MYVEFCDNHGKVTAAAGLTPTLTIAVSASGDLEIVVSSERTYTGTKVKTFLLPFHGI